MRVLASDGISTSDPVSGTSQIFRIANHAPNSPVFSKPVSGQTVTQLLRAEWIEADPVDIDGDLVTYLLDITSNASSTSPTWERIGTFGAGSTFGLTDVSERNDGNDFQLRITAIDEKGEKGSINLSPKFSIDNGIRILDTSVFEGNTYFGTSDGKLLRMREILWQVDENWAQGPVDRFIVNATEGAVIRVENGEILFLNPNGETAVLREDG